MAEAGKKFLEERKKEDGVIALESGLLYKVLREGRGMDHPKVGSPCECHYAGTLIDGSEFDSSYRRGTPTTFAPNQVIKGWTEAMQLMVEGDKWEMYIPMELAYGPDGRPPKIPPAATLVFTMEIVKIKGETVPKKIEFPSWTAEQLALWTEKDESAIQAWRTARNKSWEDGKLKDAHPTREGFDAWLDKQCLASKNKALWKRTRPQTELPSLFGADKPNQEGPPKLTKEKARELLTKAIDTFKQPANKEKLTGIIAECEKENNDPAQAGMMKMMKLMPAVQTMMGDTLKEFGFGASDLMSATMQIQGFAGEDASIAADVAKLMKAVQGDLSELLA